MKEKAMNRPANAKNPIDPKKPTFLAVTLLLNIYAAIAAISRMNDTAASTAQRFEGVSTAMESYTESKKDGESGARAFLSLPEFAAFASSTLDET